MVLHFLKAGYEKVKGALAKTGTLLGGKLRALFQGEIDEETLDRIEETLYEADLGAATVAELTEKVRQMHRKQPNAEAEEYLQMLKEEILAILGDGSTELAEAENGGPAVILIVGVNGSGKTTSIAKLARLLQEQGKKVLVAAGDTFRAAAIEQLEVWAGRTGAEIVKAQPGADPAAVAYDAVSSAKAKGADAVIIDTAGRLQNKEHLMQELEKIRRACGKAAPGSPHETLLIIDANTGQNGIDQAKSFHRFTPVSGVVLTKLDGSAKGGVVVATRRELGLPIKFIGVGEGMDDLNPFDPQSFTEALIS